MANAHQRVKKRQAAAREQAAMAAHEKAAAELKGYGVAVPEFEKVSPKILGGFVGFRGAHTGTQLQDGRNKYLQVNQREKLREQNQELKLATEQRRRRSRGRVSLVDTLPRNQTLGATGLVT